MDNFERNITNFDNLSEQEYLTKILGPQHLPSELVIPITLIYATIFITGVFGNLITCIVIKRNPTMQTATNYYLFSLAVSDLLLLVLGLPNEIYVFWQQYPWALGVVLCKIRAFVSETSSYVSVLTIVAFSMERYVAVCHPLHLYAMSGLKRPLRFILLAWMLALVCAIPFAVYTNVNYLHYPIGSENISTDSAMCAMLRDNMPDFPLYELSCLIFFLLPMLLMVALYTQMGRTIQSTSLGHSLEGTIHGENRHAQSKKTIIQMLTAVVITFFICWAPFHAQRLIYVYDESGALTSVNDWLYPIAGVLYYFSTTVNPILYNVISTKYRVAFKETLCCKSTGSHVGRDDLSSIRDPFGSSRRGSQLIRVRSLFERHHRSSQKSLNLTKQNSRSSGRMRSFTTEEKEEGHMASEAVNINETSEKLLESTKFSVVVQNCNGQIKCHTTVKEETNVPSETPI
ncbi:neuropeptides capa receptor-like [Leptopilina heterotoma]|uniref:neuropeptides capa receptor-like n=1 Tax=Leptopilina heterotoma TaxID=63436 RepID=UPI001CA7B95C|nr:neuropeptides capa receptor-like [Leptopilina heterotoma]